MRNMLIRPDPKDLEHFRPDYTIYNAGSFPANRFIEGMTSGTSVAINMAKKEIVILGTEYGGEMEMEKGVFTVLFCQLPVKHNILTLRSSANEGRDSYVVLREFTQNASLGNGDPRYACLSHCWGGSQPTKLLKSNLETMKFGIALDFLPKTFQDAIQTARGLGLNYLWIDSLCIIQGDEEDWQLEAAAMADIYGKATITIAATSAPNCHIGFLPKLDRERFFRIQLETSTKTWNIYTRPSHDHDRFGFGKESYDSTVPLRSRAWAFQEYLLSPRSLQFGPTEMVWECREHIKCECGAGFLARNSYQRLPTRIKAHYNHVLAAGPRDPAPFQKLWETIVRDYTSKKITLDSDRLPALAGISKQVGDALSLEYCAGLWVPNLRQAGGVFDQKDYAKPWFDNFAQALSWRTAFCTPGRRPEEYRAPSWSWASVEHKNGVIYALQITHPMIIVFDVRCNQDSTIANAVRGYLQVIGLMVDATLRRIGPDGPALSLVIERGGARIPVYPDVAGEGEDGETVCCLMLGVTKDRLLMLVLKRVGDGSGQYRRLGTTGSNRKAIDPAKFLSVGGPVQGFITII
jgi:hypothetical protein